MKQSIFIILTFLAFCSYGQQPAPYKPGMDIDSLQRVKQKQAIGKTFPSFTTDFQSRVFTNKDLNGKIVFINFWFATCAPCIAEFDALNELYDSLKNNKNFEFISFTYETPAVIKEMAEKYKMRYKVISIKQADCYRLNQNNGFPTSIILDANGTIKFLRSGGSTNKELARNIIFDELYPKLINEL